LAWIGRFANLFRRQSLNSDLDEELASHIEEAIAQGRSREEARRAFGGTLRYREQSRDFKVITWLDSLASDVVFGWRQLRKHPAVSAAAVLSLALAIGATTAAFRLIDAVLWRSLPVAEPQRLFFLTNHAVNPEGHPETHDDFDYPTFRQYREAVADRADLMVVGNIARDDATFGSGEPEKMLRQYLSGNVFGVFGLQPALGRLLTPNDDEPPGAHPVAVLSYDYWTRRFARAPAVLGTRFRLGSAEYQIVGVTPKGFIGTEPGLVTDVFVPATMRTEALNSPGWTWFRIWVRRKQGTGLEQIRQPLQAILTQSLRDQVKRWDSSIPKRAVDSQLSQQLFLEPAASGASDFQRNFRRPLLTLGILVALVLLVACANVGNLLTAQATARAREMALRVSIGAGKRRLLQLVLVESAMLAILASAVGALFASWSAPLVVSMLARPNEPIRLILDTDWRALGFSLTVMLLGTLLFGLTPALRVSAVKPMSALKGEDPHSRRRVMKSLVAAQMAFCLLVQFVAGLFVATLQRLSNRPLGFSAQRVLLMDTQVQAKLPPDAWMQVADHLRETPGVEAVAFAGWALMSGNRWRTGVRVPGLELQPLPPNFLEVSPGFFETMHIGLLAGREFRPGDIPAHLKQNNQPVAGVGIVNETFARVYFEGRNPVGRSVEVSQGKDSVVPMEIVGLVRDAAYRSIREPIPATVYVPPGNRNEGTFMVRTAADPIGMASVLRREVSLARSEFRADGIFTQESLVRQQLIRERLLATLSLFFAIVALVLATIGLYGVLNYSVIRRTREIGIRIALGADSARVVRTVTADVLGVVCLGSAVGLGAGIASGRFVEALLFEVRPTDATVIAAPLLVLVGAGVLAALPPAMRAARIDPAQTLRAD
jgi:putative ABC transport system permease protein